MKLSCLPVSLYDDIFSGKCTVVDWINLAHDLGLDGVDFSIKFFPDRDVDKINSICSMLTKCGIEACMIACYSDFTHPDNTKRAEELENLKSDIKLARDLGAKFVRVTAGQKHPGIKHADGIQWVADGFRYALDEAQKHGITLAYENHTKGAPWQYWDFSQPSEIFLEILNILSDTPLGVCFDTANPLVLKEDVLDLFNKVLDRIVVLHIFDMKEVGKFEPVRVGTGVSPIQEILTQLHKAEYDGWISIEEASRQARKGFEESVEYVRNTWNRTLTS
ncbi:TIM barrel protein [Candidatus Poribacteria bacterium]|nr:TIM barrel protein [Candidatus Poribacteria bacterium]